MSRFTSSLTGAYVALHPASRQPTANDTLVLTDDGNIVEPNKATAITETIPPNTDVAFPVGAYVEVMQLGAGQVTIAAGAGVTLRAPNGAKTAAQYSTLGVRQRAANEWVVTGDAVV